ncbi:MAG: PKD domain-containing protein [Flavobacteriales bacterium]|nr:PKD domain-containing protein [Flavobacteriales bacterium]
MRSFRTLLLSTILLSKASAAQSPCDSLNADFSAWVGGLSVNLQNTVISNQWSYFWTFGDGTNGYGPNTGHVYSSPGSYQICLTVWAWDAFTQDTCFADHCELVLLTGGGQACDSTFVSDFTWEDQGGGVVLFNGTSSLPATWSWWSFGDGNTGFGDPTQHFYQQPGTYTACYTAGYWNAQTQDTCFATSCETLASATGVAGSFLAPTHIYPQPATDHLNIELGGSAEVADLQLYDLTGRMVRHERSTAVERHVMDLTDLTTGQYLLQVRTPSVTRTLRVIKR